MIRLKARPRGPLAVELGPGDELELIDTHGASIPLEGRRKLLLCRCGASQTRPLCDGSHNRTRFEAPDPEPGESG